nr:alpha/beta fold hydrolase [Streptomyces sporangiiformans]
MGTPGTVPDAAGPSRRHALRRLATAAGGAALAVGFGTQAARATDAGGTGGGGIGGGRTYVLVHGTHSAGAFWSAIGRELALRGHRVVAVDQPLHGTERFVPKAYQTQDPGALATEPSPVAALTLDDFERRVTNAVRRAARLGAPVVLVGHSMGGLSVNRVANAVPELLAHICYMAAFCPSRSMPSLNACAASPEGQRAISPVDQVMSNAHDLWIGLGLDAKGVPSRVIDFWSSSRPTLHRRSGRHARAERSERRGNDRDRLPDRRHRPRRREADAGRRPGSRSQRLHSRVD